MTPEPAPARGPPRRVRTLLIAASAAWMGVFLVSFAAGEPELALLWVLIGGIAMPLLGSDAARRDR